MTGNQTNIVNKSITFIDVEVEPKKGVILDIGGINNNGITLHNTSKEALSHFVKNTQYVCGHNIFKHDIIYIGEILNTANIEVNKVIDTLFLSPLLFPAKPYHALLKDDKLQTEELNNPLNDAIKAKDLFYDEVAAFRLLPAPLQQIYFALLHDKTEYHAFFTFLNYQSEIIDIKNVIFQYFGNDICPNANIDQIVNEYPIELCYALALIYSFIQYKTVHSITPPWVLKNFPDVERILFLLRNKPCVTGCSYCQKSLNIHLGLKRFFGFDSFRSYGGEPLQEKAAKAAIDNKSLLAIFPTGGGKSITFQVPALMNSELAKALTIVISPLQSLMKDQVDNLEKLGITDAVTINGLLDPIERSKSFERIEDGSASILYISPESLRSRSIERLILGRKIARFVIDEAHCFSSWGQDFRVDYLYIGDFIKSIQEKKNLENGIPVSCFTATAKQKVIEDIRHYFREKLQLELELFTSKVSRTNLQYKVYQKGDEEDKYQMVRNLIEHRNCPTIIYVSRTRKAFMLAERLSQDGFNAKPYHGKMDKQEKSENQDAFINGNIDIMVATSAFGMGVDKKDVGMVIHYEISDSLENYIQEAGRAGRDENINADCFVLFNEEDLSKHFILLNQTKLSIKEIQQVWKAIKEITRLRLKVSNSALEIARKAGWDDNVAEIETRVTTAIAALEDAGYLQRGQNMPRIFASSIMTKTAQDAIDKINASEKLQENQKINAIRIIRKLFSSKNRKANSEEVAESRVDYISDHLGIVKEEIINIISLLREEKILADAKDLTAFIKRGEHKNKSVNTVALFSKIESFLLPFFEENEKTFHLKELNEQAEAGGFGDVGINKLKTIINFWAIKNWIKRKNLDSKNHVSVLALQNKNSLQEKLTRRHQLAKFIIDFLFVKSIQLQEESDKDEILLEFSVHELKEAYENSNDLFKIEVSIDDIEDTLFYLSRIDAIKIEGGFLVVYNRLTIERTEQNNKKQYTKDDYKKLHQFYESKIQQIHIVGEYANKMIADYRDALQFVEDYFQLNYSSFLNKYFKGSRQNEISRNITPGKFKQLFGDLSPTQLKIINDNENQHIVVAAGPGSGKTRVLVHKLASLLLMEDVKHEQLLMITFSRAAATEFKKRLLKLIGNAANFVEIKTFHSYCFDLLGKVGNLEKSGDILQKTIEKIRNNDVEASRITKTVLVIDEAQDMDKNELALITALMEQNEEMRVIAVGDDDQNIFEFRGASAEYLETFIESNKAVKHELIENYRSKNNLVDFANQFVKQITKRLKQMPIVAIQKDDGMIKITNHKSAYLISPLIQDILNTGLTGTTCVLTRTNEEALQISGLLLKNKVQAKLIQSNDGFSLYNMDEIRYFINYLNFLEDVFIIHDDVWNQAKWALVKKFQYSSKLDIAKNIIKDFELTNTKKKYRSDLEIFLKESKLEDFFNANGETIFVSTIHKSKGKEFDNVFLLLENVNADSDDVRRLLYVSLTRAKQNLYIHLNSPFLNHITVDNLERFYSSKQYSIPNELVMHLSLRDIWLGYFNHRQYVINELVSGDELTVQGNECFDRSGRSVLRFSKKYTEQIEVLKNRNYNLTAAKVNFIVYWKNEETDIEIKIVLPELYFTRKE